MGRAPCCDKANVKKGPWSPEEDAKLKGYIEKNGTGGNWIALPQKAGLRRCGKSCRLRWLNYLRPNIKHGEFSDDEDRVICTLYASIGSRWSIIAAQLPGRTDNDIKNYWNTKLKKKLLGMAGPQSQRKPHHQVHHASFSSPSSALLYNCNNSSYNTAAPSFTCFEASYSSSFSNSSASCITAASVLQLQDGFQMLGGEASCSSSDGSCSNQISQNKELEYEYGVNGVNNGEPMGMHSYNFHNEADDQSQKLTTASNGGCANGLWGETVSLDYGFEEIKQLISTSTCNNFIF